MTVGPHVGNESYGPFGDLYFSKEMVMKYEPAARCLARLDTVGEEQEKEAVQMELQGHMKLYKSMDWCSSWDGQKYDIVFYGVSGYTGYLMMQYLKKVSLVRNPEPFTFAFAGRTASQVRDLCYQEFGGTIWEDTPIMQMSYDDPTSVIDLVKSARVIINVAGPYMLAQGELLIDCCVNMGVHYCDISGEIPWTRRVLPMHKRAMKNGSFIVPSSASAGGFPDLGTMLMAKKMREEYGEELRKAICYATGGGATATASGGTLATRSAMAEGGDETRKMMSDPFALGGFVPDRDRHGLKHCNIEFGTGKVTTKLRSEDADANLGRVSEDKHLGLWRGPYVYSYFDTRIVRRSNMLQADLLGCPYGKQLNFMMYGLLPAESQLSKTGAGGGAGGAAGGGSGAGSGGGGGGGVNVEEEKARLKAEGKYFEKGSGPSLDTLDDAWGGYFLWSQTESGRETKCSFVGRDGYFETARVAIETAMCLVFDREQLQVPGGVLPAATACGTHLVARMIEGGLKFKMGEWLGPEECCPPPYPDATV